MRWWIIAGVTIAGTLMAVLLVFSMIDVLN
jgi:hypothetical protein